MECSNCGKVFEGTEQFCTMCGTQRQAQVENTQPQVSAEVVQNTATAQINDYQPRQPYQGNSEMSVKDWLLTYLICMIPCVGFVFMIMWAVKDEKISRRNYFRASFLLSAIILAIYIVAVIVMVALGVVTSGMIS